jgi:NodT family efflux transporter outer membrane factor (OMF) lipoprotein
MKRLTSLVLILSLGACAHEKPMAPQEVPPGFDQAAPGGASLWPAREFWNGFKAPELEALQAQAEKSNTDLAAAAARILEAHADVGIASAALFPQLSVSGDGAEQGSKGSGNSRFTTTLGTGGNTHKFTSRKTYDAEVGASYEIDLWGKNRSARRAAKAALVATEFDAQTVALTVTAGVADNYFAVLSLRERIAIAKANLNNALGVLKIVQSRVKNGEASALDLAQQQAAVAGQQATIPALEQTERATRAALAVLLGRPPEGFDVAGQNLDGVLTPYLAPGLPSDLLLRRPDIRSAEAGLAEASANIDVARASFFPSISLTGSGGLQSSALATLFSGAGAFYSMGASLAQPIFEGGQLIASFRLAKARKTELIATYRGTVFQAFADVETALGDVGNQTDQLRYLAEQTRASTEAFRLAEMRYREGVTDFLAVLDAQRTMYQAEDSLAQARLAALQASVTLYRVLGGGWQQQAPATLAKAG